MNTHQIIQGDCIKGMRTLDSESVDSIVTDPPYGLEFMGKKWDHGVPSTQFWIEALRVAKPGAHLLAFGGTRTYHRLTCAIEDAGWEIRDCVMWVYGSGFPKSMDVGKAIAKSTGASASQRWEGWGTVLKPAYEPIIVARKPLCGTVAENVLKHGTGALNIDDCRVSPKHGRFPANLIHDGSDEVVGLFPILHGSCNKSDTAEGTDKGYEASSYKISYSGRANRDYQERSGSAARFFYCAKASKSDRGEGNAHPTVKPTALMRYLCRLVTQPNGIVLDPFMGSGSTGKAALMEGFGFIGCEINPDYAEIAERRMREIVREKETNLEGLMK